MEAAVELWRGFRACQGATPSPTLGSFNVFNGSEPVAGLVMDSSGNLYGTTPDGAGGSGGARGNIFELAKGSNTISTLASFNGTNEGVPVAGLIMDSSGNLYGTTEYGNDGTVFEVAKGNDLGLMHRARRSPFSPLIMDSSDLYGAASCASYGYGSNTITTLASFQGGATGRNPVAGLVMDGSGDLYGTAEFGGIGYVQPRGHLGRRHRFRGRQGKPSTPRNGLFQRL